MRRFWTAAARHERAKNLRKICGKTVGDISKTAEKPEKNSIKSPCKRRLGENLVAQSG